MLRRPITRKYNMDDSVAHEKSAFDVHFDSHRVAVALSRFKTPCFNGPHGFLVKALAQGPKNADSPDSARFVHKETQDNRAEMSVANEGVRRRCRRRRVQRFGRNGGGLQERLIFILRL